MYCKIGYEVSATTGVVVKRERSVVFLTKYAARQFQKKWPGAVIRAVEICEISGKLKRRGKRAFTGRRRRR